MVIYGNNDSPNVRPWDYADFYGNWPVNRTTIFNEEIIDIFPFIDKHWVKSQILGNYPFTESMWCATMKGKRMKRL